MQASLKVVIAKDVATWSNINSSNSQTEKIFNLKIKMVTDKHAMTKAEADKVAAASAKLDMDAKKLAAANLLAPVRSSFNFHTESVKDLKAKKEAVDYKYTTLETRYGQEMIATTAKKGPYQLALAATTSKKKIADQDAANIVSGKATKLSYYDLWTEA